MQQTLRYMTKLDRAIKNEKELENLSEFYRTLNISSADLFDVLKKVTQHCLFQFKYTSSFYKVFDLLAFNSPHHPVET